MHARAASTATFAFAAVLACCQMGAPGPSSGQERPSARRPPPSAGQPAELSAYWHDGKAELAGYELVYPRYGELRRGTAVAIFVTEPFDSRALVKPEDPKRGDFDVIKLNLVQDFATGIYDYNLMTSAFVATKARGRHDRGSTVKVSFSAQEWCGHVFSQLLLRDDRVQYTSHSYFEGEADQQQALEYAKTVGGSTLTEDALLLWARRLAGPVLPPGGSNKRPILRALERVRLLHVPLRWDEVLLERADGSETVETPAGRFEIERASATIDRGDGTRTRWSFEVEKAFPHRIVRFGRDDGLSATLLGATRQPYWKLHDNGQESYLGELGLSPRPPRTP